MRFIIDSRSPVYKQVIRYFKEQIASGNIEPNTQMPSRRQLAEKLKINPNTVQRAYKEMEEAGLIYTDGNMPSKVTSDRMTIQKIRAELVYEAVDHFVSTLHKLNLPLEEMLPILEQQYAKRTGSLEEE